MGLIITPFLVLLLWDDAVNLIENFQSKKKVAKQGINLTATREPLYVEDVNRSMVNMHHLTKKQKDGEFRRQVYPYSVVDGGVDSVQELRSAISLDPVVAKHYSNFKLDRARVIEAKAERDFHVSYRIGEEIFWTKKRLNVAKGERLITDGTNVTRTRCANVLSEVPRGKTSPDEPAPKVLDTPLNPPSDPAPFIPPVVTGGGALDPPSEPTPFMPPGVIGGVPLNPPSDPAPFIPPVVIGGGPLDPAGGGRDRDGDGDGEGNPPVPAPVPEPTTMLLLGSGLLGLWGLRKKFKK
jgi:hypothetical protein